MSLEDLRPNTRGGDTWTVLLLSLCNLIVPLIAYVWGIVRLSQTNRWNKIQKLGLVLILPVLFLLPAFLFTFTRGPSQAVTPSVADQQSVPATCDARRVVVALARSVGGSVDVPRSFNSADFSWVSDPERSGTDAASYATLPSYFARLADMGERWSVINFVGHRVHSGLANFEGELRRDRTGHDDNAHFKGALRCSTGTIVALSIGSPIRS